MDLLNLAFWLFVAIIAGIYVIMALGLYVQFSLAGLPNFGHVAFMAVAAYTMAILVIRCSVPLGLAALAGIAAAICLALILGIPSVRLRADYLAIATVAGGEIVRYLAMNLPGLTGGPMGSIGMLGPGQIAMYNPEWQALLDRIAAGLSSLTGRAVTRDGAMAITVWVLAAVLLQLCWRL
jgi:branched-chain amino acid transport system permease protein